MIRDVLTQQDIDDFLELSKTEAVFLMKHSTVCGVSAAGWSEYQDFSRSHEKLSMFRVLVRENRDLSLAIAERTKVPHESPQAILYYKGEAVWSASHFGISQANLSEALDSLKIE